MAQTPTDAGTTDPGETTTDFDDQDDLLRRLFELCSPEQRGRGGSPREVLARLSAAERVQLLDRLSPALRDEVRRLIGR